MKIIDLLNKIANGEGVPKKINVYSYLWTFDIEKHDYTNIHNTVLFNDFIDNIITDSLNDEVEIIEEEKEIKKFDTNKFHDIDELVYKINDLIDVINDMRDKE